MQTWAYPARIEDQGVDGFLVTFPDVPEAITGGDTLAEARANAADALEEAILAYMAMGRAIPPPRAARKGEQLIVLDPVTAARAILAQAMATDHVTNVALAKRLGKSEGAVRRLTDGATGVKIDTVLEALEAVGRRAVLSLMA